MQPSRKQISLFYKDQRGFQTGIQAGIHIFTDSIIVITSDMIEIGTDRLILSLDQFEIEVNTREPTC